MHLGLAPGSVTASRLLEVALTEPPKCSWKAGDDVAQAWPHPWIPGHESETSATDKRGQPEGGLRGGPGRAGLESTQPMGQASLGTCGSLGSTVSGKSPGALLVQPEEAENEIGHSWAVCLFPVLCNQCHKTGCLKTVDVYSLTF